MKANTKLSKSLATVIIMLSSLLIISCGGSQSPEDMGLVVTGKLKECGDLITTKIDMRTIATIYIQDGRVGINPKTWAIDGDSIVVVVPVDFKVEYGYDIESIEVDVVKTDDENSEVWVYLAEPQIINKELNPKVPKEYEVLPSSARPSQGDIKRGMLMAFNEAIKNLDTNTYRKEIEANAQIVFENILKATDYKIKAVHIANLKDKH